MRMQKAAPRLVLVHGSLSSRASWVAYPGLIPDIEVATPDLPGHGDNRDLQLTTASALEVIGYAVGETTRPVVLAGHSLGGYLSALWAHRNPGRLSGLVLMGASGNPAGRLAGVYKAFARYTRRADHEKLARRRDALARRLGVRADHLPAAASYDGLPLAWQAVFDDCPPWIMSTIDVPVLYLNGQFDQMRIHEKRYLDITPNPRLRIIKGATHFAPLTHERQVAAELSAFVREVAILGTDGSFV